VSFHKEYLLVDNKQLFDTNSLPEQ